MLCEALVPTVNSTTRLLRHGGSGGSMGGGYRGRVWQGGVGRGKFAPAVTICVLWCPHTKKLMLNRTPSPCNRPTNVRPVAPMGGGGDGTTQLQH